MNVKDNVQNEAVEMMQYPDYKAEIVEVLRCNLIPKIKQERILAYHEKDIADALKLLSLEERSRLYRILSADTLADILEYTGPVICRKQDRIYWRNKYPKKN